MTAPRAFRLDARATWRDEPSLAGGISVDGVVRLLADTDAPLPLADPYGTFGGLADPSGAAADRDGRAYRVDTKGCQVLRYGACSEDAWAPLPCSGGRGPGIRQLDDPHGAAVNPAGDLVVADTGNKRLVVFAPDGVAVRRVIGAPDGYPQWTPWDVAVGAGGRLLVSDRTGDLVHVLTCQGDPLAAWGSVSSPTALAVDRECRVYVVQAGNPAVQVLGTDGTPIGSYATTAGLVDRFLPAAFVVGPDGTVHLAGEGAAPLPRYAGAGTFVTTSLDSGLHRCRWHRVRLEASVAAGTSVTVQTLTSEVPLSAPEIDSLPAARWHGGQVHGVVGEAPWDCLLLAPPGRYLWLRLTLGGSGASTPEVRGIVVEYPRITSARFLPAVFREAPASADFTERFVSLLDAVRSTVEDQVAGFAALLDPYACPDGTDGGKDFLGWLASWLGLAGDLRLLPARRRRLVAEAHRLYRLRGTPAGIVAQLEICLGVPVRLLEDFSLRRWMVLGTGRLGDRADLWGADVVPRLQLDANRELGAVQLVGATDPLRDPFHAYAHRFRVYLTAADTEETRRLAERVVELAKPAHTDCRVIFAQPRMRVGVQAFIGVDSVVGAYPPGLAPSNSLPVRPSLRVGLTTRVGTSAVLD
jgi:phage tail-like protein